MTSLDLYARLALAVLYATAALAKLASRQGTRQIIDSYGFGERMVPAVRLLPFAELAVAAGLLVPGASRGAAGGSCALLVAFSAAIDRSIRQGRTGTCNCFGRMHTAEIGPRLLARNAVLLVASAAVVVGSRQLGVPMAWKQLASTPTWLAVVAAACGLALAAIAAWRRARRTTPLAPGRPASGRDKDAPPGPVPLSSAPVLVTTLAGRTSELVELLVADDRNVLVFVDPGCAPCQSLLAGIRAAGPAALQGLLLVTRGPEDLNRELLSWLPLDQVLLDGAGALAARYGVDGTPAAVEITASGPGRGSPQVGLGAVARLVGVDGDAPGPGTVLDRVLTRRESLTVGVTSALLALGMPRLGRVGSVLHRYAAGRLAPVRCPSCGTCVVCEAPQPGESPPGKLSCRPCKKRCSTNDLCANYANKMPAYLSIHSYLVSQGFAQSSDPTALGLEHNGSLTVIGTTTELASSSATNPRAVLTYALANGGETAAAAILDAHGRITSVVGAAPGGRVTVADVAAHPVVPRGSGARGRALAESPAWTPVAVTGGELAQSTHVAHRVEDPAPEDAVLTVSSCGDVCGVMFALMLAVATPLIAGVALNPASIAFGLGISLASAASGQSGVGFAMAEIAKAATLENLMLDGYKYAAKKTICKYLICNTSLQACCSYTRACYNSDAVCEQRCPGSLAHPMAHCDVYIVRAGKKIKISVLSP